MISYVKDSNHLFKGYSIKSENPIHQLALYIIVHWPNPKQLIAFAQNGNGFGNANNQSGIDYPNDLDEYDKAVEGRSIPPQMILLYAEHFTVHKSLIYEKVYLHILQAYIKIAVDQKSAQLIKAIIDKKA